MTGKDFKKIGEHYYTKHTAGETTDSEIDEFIASIDSHKTVIMEVETQIRALKEEAATPHSPTASVSSLAMTLLSDTEKIGMKHSSY